MIKIDTETKKQITAALRVSLIISVVVTVSMLMFGTNSRYTLMEIAGLFPAMIFIQFTGILVSIGFLKLTQRPQKTKRIPFL